MSSTIADTSSPPYCTGGTIVGVEVGSDGEQPSPGRGSVEQGRPAERLSPISPNSFADATRTFIPASQANPIKMRSE